MPVVSLQFANEASFSVSAKLRCYRSSPVGTRAVEISSHPTDMSYTLTLLVGVGGIIYGEYKPWHNTSSDFCEFIRNACSGYILFGIPILGEGNCLILDNAAIHTHHNARLIPHYLEEQNIDLKFLPCFSPNTNPVENCFTLLHTILKKLIYSPLLLDDVPTAVLTALPEISQQDIASFYGNVTSNYLNMAVNT